MRIFIVGATGVLGRAVVPRLLARGDEVVALVRSLERAETIAGPGVELFEGDLLREAPERLRTMLTGCDVVDSSSAENMLAQISKFNDAVQAFIFNPDALAPTFPESAITKPFPFNAYYDLDDAPDIDGKDWKLEVRGLVENKKSWTLDELYKLPEVTQITRHICVEGWSAIGSWTGTPLRDFLKLIGADTRASGVGRTE